MRDAKFGKYTKQVNKITSANLKKLRRLAGYRSASEFARTHKIPVQTYINHESGKRGIDVARGIIYTRFLKVDFSELLIGVERYEK
jgi:hypothetical protein